MASFLGQGAKRAAKSPTEGEPENKRGRSDSLEVSSYVPEASEELIRDRQQRLLEAYSLIIKSLHRDIDSIQLELGNQLSDVKKELYGANKELAELKKELAEAKHKEEVSKDKEVKQDGELKELEAKLFASQVQINSLIEANRQLQFQLYYYAFVSKDVYFANARAYQTEKESYKIKTELYLANVRADEAEKKLAAAEKELAEANSVIAQSSIDKGEESVEPLVPTHLSEVSKFGVVPSLQDMSK